MDKQIENIVLRATGAKSIEDEYEIQSLWSGYGSIVRVEISGASLNGNACPSVVVKHVNFPKGFGSGKRGRGELSHQRKVKSYKVETNWYRSWSSQCDDLCRVPKCLALDSLGDDVVIVMEDLDASGFGERRSSLDWGEVSLCLHWLANFHAVFLGENPEGGNNKEKLWKTGTYWHLATRPDELNILNDMPLKKGASKIDRLLADTPFKTFVHGDAKLANFCFSPDGTKVAAVDFQYVGGGCGMKDVAYLTGSCFYDGECEDMEKSVLDVYFKYLREGLQRKGSDVDLDALEENWRGLYRVAWTDFHRFLKGWGAGRWSDSSYSERVAAEVLGKL